MGLDSNEHHDIVLSRPQLPQAILHSGLAYSARLQRQAFRLWYACQAAGLIGLTAYFSYLAGDYFGFSGIVSLFFCAVLISHYAMRNISKQQREATLSLFETLSFLSEGSIFVYVGLDALDPQKWEVRLKRHPSDL